MSRVHKLQGKKKIAHRIFIILFCLWVLLPIYFVFVMSVTPGIYLSGTRLPAMVPREPTLHSFQALLFPDSIDHDAIRGDVRRPVNLFRNSVFNSTVVASISAFFGVMFGVFAAYSFDRFKFPGKNITFMLVLGSRLIAAVTLAIPLFTLFRDWGILDSYWPLLFLYIPFNMCWAALIMQNYFSMLPEQLEEAALIDGCSRFGAFLRVILPAARPGIVAVLIITFLFSWGEFLYALLFTMTEGSRTLPVALSMFIGEFEVAYQLLGAALLLSVIPPVLLGIAFQKYIIAGLTSGTIK